MELLNTTEIAEILGVTPGRVKQLIADRRLIPVLGPAAAKGSGRDNLCRRADVDEMRSLLARDPRSAASRSPPEPDDPQEIEPPPEPPPTGGYNPLTGSY